jgi:GDPmannose 4,6-dehydratase
MKNKTSIISGVSGQDGSYLAEFLLDHDYRVFGLYRRTSNYNLSRIHHLLNNPQFKLIEFDLTDPASCNNVMKDIKPDEFYNLAAQSHVGTSFKQPTNTFQVNTMGVVNILEAIRDSSPATKFYQASTSEMFGHNYDIDSADGSKYQDELTAFFPQSPYGVSKLASHNMTRIYRDGYGIFGCCGILFNHESPRRGVDFVTRKITKWIGEYLHWCEKHAIRTDKTVSSEDNLYLVDVWSTDEENKFPKLKLGNLSAKRDWGHAKDYVKAMWLMLQKDTPEDYIVATGVTKSVEDFLTEAFRYSSLGDFNNYTIIDKDLFRPAEVEYLRGSSTKARVHLGWTPETSFDELVHDMVDHDMVDHDRNNINV